MIERSKVRMNSRAHQPGRDALIGALNEACRAEGWRAYEGFAVYLEASFRAQRSAALKIAAPSMWQANEDEYMKLVRRCRAAGSMKLVKQMHEATADALEADRCDFLGPIFSEVAASTSMGQFLSPWELSKLLAEMTLPQGPPNQTLFMQEPAGGVGGMVLAAAEVARERGWRVHRDMHWDVIDVDFRACCAAYIQLNLCGISATVFHGNTLTLDCWMATPTMAALLHPKVRRAESAPIPLAPPSTPGEQLSFF